LDESVFVDESDDLDESAFVDELDDVESVPPEPPSALDPEDLAGTRPVRIVGEVGARAQASFLAASMSRVPTARGALGRIAAGGGEAKTAAISARKRG